MSAFRIVEPIEFLEFVRFFINVERFGSSHLHPIGQLEAVNPRRQFWLKGVLLEAPAIELRNKVELLALPGGVHVTRRDEVIDQRALRFERGSLVDSGQKTGAPILAVPLGNAAS